MSIAKAATLAIGSLDVTRHARRAQLRASEASRLHERGGRPEHRRSSSRFRRPCRSSSLAEISEPPIEYELLRDATLAEIWVPKTEINPTSGDDKHVQIEGRLGLEEDDDGEPVNDAEHCAFGFIYALGVLSFADARPRGVSGMHFEEKDDWAVGDMLRRLRFERGELRFYADYVRGRCMKATSSSVQMGPSYSTP